MIAQVGTTTGLPADRCRSNVTHSCKFTWHPAEASFTCMTCVHRNPSLHSYVVSDNGDIAQDVH